MFDNPYSIRFTKERREWRKDINAILAPGIGAGLTLQTGLRINRIDSNLDQPGPRRVADHSSDISGDADTLRVDRARKGAETHKGHEEVL